MPALSIQIPYPIFSDRDGQPLENGYVWIGQPYLDPQTNPVQVYLDDALTIPVAQPLRTIGGYVSNSGTPAQLYINGVNFSIRVQDNKGTLVYYFPDGSGINPDAAGVTYNPGPDSLLLPGGPISVKAALDEITDDETGSSVVGFLQAGNLAVPTTVQAKLRETVSVLDFGADPTGGTDSTPAVQAAIDHASATGKTVWIPAGTYKIVPATPKTDENGVNANLASIIMRSNMHIEAAMGAVFRIADGISSDASPRRMSMFFSNEVLQNISFIGLTMDMNGQNNLVSPNRASFVFNNSYTQAFIVFSGTPSGVAAGADNVLVRNCQFLNTAGVSCIIMAQSESVGIALRKNWEVSSCKFYNNGFDTNDHSSIYGWATDVRILNNSFENLAPPLVSGGNIGPGAFGAHEVHGSRQLIQGNTVINYYGGYIIGQNRTEQVVRNIVVCDNIHTSLRGMFSFWSANTLYPFAVNESWQEDVIIENNTCNILPGPVVEPEGKSFIRIPSRRTPSRVRIANNIVRSTSTATDTALVYLGILPDHWLEGRQIVIENNVATGLSVGLNLNFAGSTGFRDVEQISFLNNNLGTLINVPGGIPAIANKPIRLDGVGAGVVDSLWIDDLTTTIYANLGLANRTGAIKNIIDYEEGTFTFTLGDGTNNFTTSGTTTATYIRVGKVVTCSIDYSWSNKGSASGAFFCTAGVLPYQVASGHQVRVLGSLRVSGGSSDTYAISPTPAAVGRTARIVKNSAATDALVSDMPTAGTLSFQFSYIRS